MANFMLCIFVLCMSGVKKAPLCFFNMRFPSVEGSFFSVCVCFSFFNSPSLRALCTCCRKEGSDL